MATLVKRRRGNDPAVTRSFFPDLFDFERYLDMDFPKLRTTSQVPMVNIREEKDKFKLELAAPGMTKDDFDIEVDNQFLTISYEKETENKEEEDNYSRREYNYNSFSRCFNLPEFVDEKKINAHYENGVLMVELPKKAEAKAKEQTKRIQIK